MRYPIAFVIPILMLLDYYLTLLGFVLYQRYYEKHIEMEQYELNPSFQVSVRSKKYFNLRHFGYVLLMLGMAVAINLFIKEQDVLIEGVLGALFAVLSVAIGGHFASILTFRKVGKSPDAITGHVRLDYLLSLKVSQYHLFVPAVVLLAMVVISPSPTLIGGFVGVAYLALVFERWRLIHLRKLRKELAGTADSELPKETAFSKFVRITFTVVKYAASVMLVLFTMTVGFVRGYFIPTTILILILVPGAFLAATFLFRRRRAFAVLLAAFAGFAVVAYFSHDPLHKRIKDEGAEVINAINEYNLRYGHFPESLDELSLPHLTHRYGGWFYESSPEGDDFVLEIGNYELYRFVLWWDTESDMWRLDDY